MLLSIFKNKQVWLLGLTGVLAFVVARWTVPINLAFALVVKGGYWVMLLTLALFARAVWRVAQPAVRRWRPGWYDLGALVLILVVGGIWQAHEERGFKILADEVLLLGTSMDMHYEREATYPVRATDVQGPFQVLQSVLDKRPLFFPFVVSLVHDLTGYRATNPFYVNALLGFVFLALVYLLGTKVGGTRWAGALGVLLFAGLPLMAQQATGGGFDLLNLVMIGIVLLLASRFAERPDDVSTEALCLATVILAQTRYESTLFIFPVAALILWGWPRVQRIILPWTLWLIPLLLMPYVLQNRRFEVDAGTWELAGQGGNANTPFALHYLPDNLGHALAFLFDSSGYQPNSILFGALGLLALPLFGIWITRILRGQENRSAVDVAVATIGVGLLAVNALLMVYFWGQFDHPVIRRLSLPLHLCMMLAICVVIVRWIRGRWKWQIACGAAIMALFFQGLPAMAKRAYEKDYTPGVEMAWRQKFIQRFPARDYLFVDRDSVFWITQRIAATPVLQAQLRKEGLAYHLRNHSFSAMYAFQRFHVDDQTGHLNLEPKDDLGPGFQLEPVWEKRISTLLIGRISRITAIDYEGVVSQATEFVTPDPGPKRTAEQLEQARTTYLENWIKQLP